MDTHRRPFNQILDSKCGWGTEYHGNRMGVSQSSRKKDAATRRGYLDAGELEDGEWPSQERGTSNRTISSRKEPSHHHQPSAKKSKTRGKKKAKTDMGFGNSTNPNFVPVAPRASGGYVNSPKLSHSPPLPDAAPSSPPRYSFFTASPTVSPTKRARGRGEKKAPTDKGFVTSSANPNFVPVASRASGGYVNSPKLSHSPPLPDAPPPPLPPFPNLPSSASPPLPNKAEPSSAITDISAFKSQLDSLRQKLERHQDAKKEWEEKQQALTEEMAVLEKTVNDYRTLYYKADEFGKRTFAELLHYKAWMKERGLEVPAFEPSIENVNAYIISERDKVDFKTALQIFRVESTHRENGV